MRLPPILLTLVLLVALALSHAATAQARSTSPGGEETFSLPRPQSQSCAALQSALAQWGKPSAEAILLASSGGQQTQVAQQVADVYVVRAGDTLARIAGRYGTTVPAIVSANAIRNQNLIYPGQRLHVPGAATVAAVAAALPAPVGSAWIDGSAVQGEAALVWLRTAPGTTVSGRLGSQTIPFRTHCDLQWGLVAFDALDDNPGIYNLTLDVTTNGSRSTVSLPITLRAGNYGMGRTITLPADKQHLRDPNLITAERQRLNNLFASLPASAPRWSGPFMLPLNSHITQSFGFRGSADGRTPINYHEGIDFRGAIGTPIPAAAPGVVVLAEFLTVRGGTVFIDHGAGVITGYFHMSEIGVRTGDTVSTSQILGKVGTTGFSTGPHLHWEMRVNGRYVNPMPFTRRSIP
jgi:murein DD-endopeptidase MepM/ murein hydrolase activator NlpD